MNRVVVTGLGALTPIGNSVDEFWNNAVSGKSGAAKISKFDPSDFKVQFACEVKGFDADKYLDRNEIKRSDLFTQYALYTASEALEDSGVDLESISPYDVGVIWASGQGGMKTFEDEVKNYVQNEFKPQFNPFFVPKFLTNMAAGLISMKFGLMGINFTTVSACAAANSAIMDAFNYIRWNTAKIIITGGSEAPIHESVIGGFSSMRAMSTRNEHPKEASRPFDVDRDGLVIGEGAGALVLEEYEHAKNRGAKIYAEVVGAASTADAYHISSSHPEGKGASKAMELAMADAGINRDDVEYINTHATSTMVGDISEIKAVKNVFGHNPDHLRISATKSMTGHLLGAAGAVEAVLSVKSVEKGVIPPTINTTVTDPQIPLNFPIVCGEAIEQPVKIAMSNTFGFGGHNTITIFKKI